MTGSVDASKDDLTWLGGNNLKQIVEGLRAGVQHCEGGTRLQRLSDQDQFFDRLAANLKARASLSQSDKVLGRLPHAAMSLAQPGSELPKIFGAVTTADGRDQQSKVEDGAGTPPWRSSSYHSPNLPTQETKRTRVRRPHLYARKPFDIIRTGAASSPRHRDELLHLVSIGVRLNPFGIAHDCFSISTVRHPRRDVPHPVGNLVRRQFQVLHSTSLKPAGQADLATLETMAKTFLLRPKWMEASAVCNCNFAERVRSWSAYLAHPSPYRSLVSRSEFGRGLVVCADNFPAGSSVGGGSLAASQQSGHRSPRLPRASTVQIIGVELNG